MIAHFKFMLLIIGQEFKIYLDNITNCENLEKVGMYVCMQSCFYI